MKPFIFTLLATVGISPLAQSQFIATSEYNPNNIRCRVSSNGVMFNDYGLGIAGFEAPTNSGRNTIYIGGLWLGGIDESDELRVSSFLYRDDNELDYSFYGPAKTDGSPNIESEVEEYNRVWFASAPNIENHIEYYECVWNPDCNVEDNYPNGYSIPQSIIDWPASGNAEYGHSEYLAPFVDVDGDSLYIPENGDYPAICGRSCAYIIWNDVGLENSANPFGHQHIGLEVHTMIYGEFSNEESLDNTIFVKHRMFNRGPHNLSNVYLGIWTDFDLGNYADDYIGTDVQRAMIYAYNGDNEDEDYFGFPGYGTDLPAMGIKVLNGPLQDPDGIDNPPLSEEFETYGPQSNGWGDGVPDNERLGLTGSIFFNGANGGPAATLFPETSLDFYRYLQISWQDDLPFTFGSDGYNPDDQSALPASYAYPGLTDPLHNGTEGIDPEYDSPLGWTEVAEGNMPGDRRMIGTIGPFSLPSEESQSIDLAYIFARESMAAEETELMTLRRFADEITGLECENFDQITLSTEHRIKSIKPLTVFPNPSNGVFQLDFPNDATRGIIIIRDINGRTVHSQRIESGLEINSGLDKGIYFIELSNESYRGVSKLIIN